MKIKQTVLSLTLLFAVLLAACSPQAPSADAMVKDDMVVDVSEENGAETMSAEEDKMSESDDDVMAEGDAESMSAEGDEMAVVEEDEMTESGDNMMADESEETMSGEGDEMMADEEGELAEQADDGMAEEAMMTPDWFNATLTEARTGETFTIADFEGKVILVETLAMWCSNCLLQQEQVLALHGLLGERDDFVSLGIDIDPNENMQALQSYIERNGFGWNYTVAPVEVAREIGMLYGDQFLNPPSTPMLIIDRHGEVHLLPFGIKGAGELLEALQPFLDEGM